MKRTAIYIRVSSDKQVQEGDSISAQRDALRKYIDTHESLTFAGEYMDDGISGTKEDRDELQRMLSDVKAGKIDLILVTKLDRLYRSIRHYLNLQDTLDKCGVNWLAIWETIYDTSTPQGRLIINQMMSIAQFEAENTGQRIRQVQAYKVQQGEVISGRVPPGYRIIDKHLVPDENADLVREMFQYYSLCGNLNRTMREFEYTGIFPRTKPAYKNLLMNEKYIGRMRNNDHFCEPIIDKDLFADVQRKLKMNVKSSQKHTYIFSGLIHCAVCGKAMGAGIHRKKRSNSIITYHRYRCSGRYNQGINRCTNTKQIYENVMEKHLLETIRPEIEKIVYHAEVEQMPVKDNRDKITALEKKIDKLKDLYINDLITLDEYKIDKERLQAEVAALTAQAAEEQPDLTALKEFLNSPFEQLYETFSDEEKRFFWRSIIKDIRFGGDRSVQIIFL